MSPLRSDVARMWWHARPGGAGRAFSMLGRTERSAAAVQERVQVEALGATLEAAARVPFHAERLRAAGLAPAAGFGLEELRRLPPLERTDVQRLGVERLRVPGRGGWLVRTSGSSGRPVEHLRSHEAAAWIAASDRRAAAWAGISLGEPRLAVVHAHGSGRMGPHGRRARAHAASLALGNTAVLFADELHEPGRRAAALARLAGVRPALAQGVAGMLYAAALALGEDARRLGARCVWSGGNDLPAHQAAAVAEAFGCPVRQRYASWEAGAIAHECPAGGLHVNAESVLVEVVADDGRPAAPGELGEVLVTTLRNRSMPLLRYRLGDLVEAVGPEPCACRRSLPLLGRLVGRDNALLHGAGGRLVSPEAVTNVLRWCPSAREFEAEQAADGRLVVRVVQADHPAAAADRDRIAATLDEALGVSGATSVERVGRLTPDGAGKLRHVVSHAGRRGP